MRDRYNIIYQWNDGTEDSLNFTSLEDLEITLTDIHNCKEKKLLAINRIKKNGEYVTFKTLSIVNNLIY